MQGDAFTTPDHAGIWPNGLLGPSWSKGQTPKRLHCTALHCTAATGQSGGSTKELGDVRQYESSQRVAQNRVTQVHSLSFQRVERHWDFKQRAPYRIHQGGLHKGTFLCLCCFVPAPHVRQETHKGMTSVLRKGISTPVQPQKYAKRAERDSAPSACRMAVHDTTFDSTQNPYSSPRFVQIRYVTALVPVLMHDHALGMPPC